MTRREFSGAVWRHVPKGAHPLDLQHLLQAAGRWNRRGQYGALYTALAWEGAVAEYSKHLHGKGLRPPRDLVEIEVGVAPILDVVALLAEPSGVPSPLTGRPVQPPLHGESVLRGGRPEDLEACRLVADWARGQGFLGLLVPSSPSPGKVNLVVFPENRPNQLSLSWTGRRVCLNYGAEPLVNEDGEIRPVAAAAAGLR